jgi:plasmid stabilization system protein ParE
VRVVFTGKAENGLRTIGDYIAQDSPRRAVSFMKELREAAMALGESPLAFPVAPGFETYGIRRRTYGNYLILYRVSAERVEILHILHGARDVQALFGDGF